MSDLRALEQAIKQSEDRVKYLYEVEHCQWQNLPPNEAFNEIKELRRLHTLFQTLATAVSELQMSDLQHHGRLGG